MIFDTCPVLYERERDNIEVNRAYMRKQGQYENTGPIREN